jgi:hypothetical protein
MLWVGVCLGLSAAMTPSLAYAAGTPSIPPVPASPLPVPITPASLPLPTFPVPATQEPPPGHTEQQPADSGATGNPKVTMCHASSSASNPYEVAPVFQLATAYDELQLAV